MGGCRQPNGVVLEESQVSSSSSSSSSCFSPEVWAHAEQTTNDIIQQVQPTVVSEERKRDVIDYVQRLLKRKFRGELLPFGSVPLKTYLPDADIDLTAFGAFNLEEAFLDHVYAVLDAEDGNPASEFVVKDVQYIYVEVKLVKCLVQNIVVNISFNQIGGLCALCFLEEVDRLIGKDHLFKRSIILIKAWCYYERCILGAHHGLISTYALETLVLYIFNLFHSSLSGPLAVLHKFLDYFSKFDWENYCVSLNGPVHLSSLPEIVAERPESSGGDLLLSDDFMIDCVMKFSVPSRRNEPNYWTFMQMHLNIVDPLEENNNLGCSVSKGNFFRIRSDFSYGAWKLGQILLQPQENLAEAVRKFFTNTLDRHGLCNNVDSNSGYSSMNVGALCFRDSHSFSQNSRSSMQAKRLADLSGDADNHRKNLKWRWHYADDFARTNQPIDLSWPSTLQKKFWDAIRPSLQMPKARGTGTHFPITNHSSRVIGKITVADQLIAEGSNGTMVFAGVYEDDRPVVVKRYLREIFNVTADREIKNLICSDRHPNVVRYHGVEKSDSFVYVALERCDCSLSDLVHFEKGKFTSMSAHTLNLLNEMEVKLDINLWKTTTAYPCTPHLQKVMRDIVLGVSHLHQLGIIHRDLKPQNILLIKEKDFCAKIADMGISKKLAEGKSSLTHATGSGTSGWRAPEQLCEDLCEDQHETRAVDLYTLGLVLFYSFTKGEHPFGDKIERDFRIKNNFPNWDLIKDCPEAMNLFMALLDPNPQFRPSAHEVLHHPLLWHSEMRLSFYRDVSCRLESRKGSSVIMTEVEKSATLVFSGQTWYSYVDQQLIHRPRASSYNFQKVSDLVRFIRNTLVHHDELPPYYKVNVLPLYDRFDEYFRLRFPHLFIVVYSVIEKHCKGEQLFCRYFS